MPDRYALFTLAGIAGEDDLDAPDLPTPTPKPADWQKPEEGSRGQLNGKGKKLGQATIFRDHAQSSSQLPHAILTPEASGQIRDRLIAEIANLVCGDDAALWAQRSLGEKADAGCVERAFDIKLRALGGSVGDATQGNSEPSKLPVARPRPTEKQSRSKRINKSLLQLSEARRIRDREHVKLVAQQPLPDTRPTSCGRPSSSFSPEPGNGTKPVMNSLFRSVAVTTARTLETKLRGGEVRGSIRPLRLAHYGSKVIRCKTKPIPSAPPQ